jgi:Rrf2 family protein
LTFTKTTEYSMQILAVMVRERKPLYSSEYLFKKLKIPRKYLQRLLTLLTKKGILKSSRGKFGGYALTEKAAELALSDIIAAVQGFVKEPGCFFGLKKCRLAKPCIMHNVWAEQQHKIVYILSTTKLSNL